jgi:hypothetical protein
MTTAPTRHVTWRKSSRSSGQDTCVELAGTLNAVRDSKNVDGPELRGNVAALVAWVKAGQIQA